MNLKYQILMYFLSNFYKKYEDMKNATHALNANNLNPYHMENDTWAHTMLVYNSINYINPNYLDVNSKESIAFSITSLCAALLHDIGKIEKRKIDETRQKVTFYNHGEAGTQFTIDFVYKMLKDKSFTDTLPIQFNNEEIGNIVKNTAFLVCNHMSGYDAINYEKYLKDGDYIGILNLCNYDKELIYYMNTLLTADEIGQIAKEHSGHKNPTVRIAAYENAFNNCDELKILREQELSNKELKFGVFCGLPGSGKDHYAELNEFDEILSFDKIRVTLYKNSSEYKETDNEKLIYQKAFEYCEKRKPDLLSILDSQIKHIRKNDYRKKIAICNTNISKKVRAQLSYMINNYKKSNEYSRCYYIASPTEVCVNNDILRSDKTVKLMVIQNIAKTIYLPTYSEKFDDIKIIFNDFKI